MNATIQTKIRAPCSVADEQFRQHTMAIREHVEGVGILSENIDPPNSISSQPRNVLSTQPGKLINSKYTIQL